MTTSIFAQTIMDHEKTLFGYSSRFLNDYEDRKDLVQETYTKALMNMDKFRENTNLRGWLCTIMYNTYINQYHKDVRFRNYQNEKAEAINSAVFNMHSYESPEMHTRMVELQEQIDKLADEFRIPLRKYLSGFKYKEIAEELNMPIGTVKHKIFKAREKLGRTMLHAA